MSEHLQTNEHHKQPESGQEDLENASKEQLDRLQAEAREAAVSEADAEHRMEDLEQQAESEAKSQQEVTVEQPQKAPEGGMTVLGTQAEAKQQSYERKLKQVQSHLSGPERGLSKVIHKPTVDTVSEVSGQTLFRAAGILGGALFALVGSIILLYASKHYGFSYNYLAFLILFVLGYFVGLLAEVVLRLLLRRR